MSSAGTMKTLLQQVGKVFGKDDGVVEIVQRNGWVSFCGTGPDSVLLTRCETTDTTEIECSIPLDPFVKVMDGCGDGDVEFRMDGEKLRILSSIHASIPTITQPKRMEIQHGDSSFDVPTPWLRQAMQLGQRFASKEMGRFALNVGRFERDGDSVSFVATDGRKAVWCDLTAENPAGRSFWWCSIPRKAMETLQSMLPSESDTMTTISMGERGIKFTTPDAEFWCLQQEGRFPDGWREVFPKINQLSPVDVKTLRRMVGVMNAVSIEKARFTVKDGSLEIEGKSASVPDVRCTISASLPEGSLLVSPSILASSIHGDNIQFGWGTDDQGAITAAATKMGDFYTISLGIDDPAG
jgi:DNA polymerase III sliding clamp (beta) subunit (PCNA family)